MKDIIDLCKTFHVYEKSDMSNFQRRARLLQSIWREEQGFEIGRHKSRNSQRLLGSRLQMPWAKETLANYISDVTKDVVCTEVSTPKANGKLFSKPRIFNDLLSSQPLCFNLFAELQKDLSLASKVFTILLTAVFNK